MALYALNIGPAVESFGVAFADVIVALDTTVFGHQDSPLVGIMTIQTGQILMDSHLELVDLLVMPEDSACRFCGVDFRARFSCAKCHTTDDISYKICNDCGLIICILCLAGTSAGPGVLPSECPQCGSEEFQMGEQASVAPSP